MAESETTYTVEYAKSGRAGCKGPKALCEAVSADRKIEKGELRLGTSFVTERGPSSQWKHWRCVTAKVLDHIGSVANLEGFSGLRKEDQARVRRAFELGYVEEGKEAEDKLQADKAAAKGAKAGAKSAEKAAAKKEKEPAKAAAKKGRPKKAPKEESEEEEEEASSDDDAAVKKAAPAAAPAARGVQRVQRERKRPKKLESPGLDTEEMDEDEAAVQEEAEEAEQEEAPPAKQGRGRPKKAAPAPAAAAVKKPAGKRGRPKKVVSEEAEEDSDE